MTDTKQNNQTVLCNNSLAYFDNQTIYCWKNKEHKGKCMYYFKMTDRRIGKA